MKKIEESLRRWILKLKSIIGKRGILGILAVISGLAACQSAQHDAIRTVAQAEHDTGRADDWNDINGMIGVTEDANRKNGANAIFIGCCLIAWGLKKYKFPAKASSDLHTAQENQAEK